MCSTACQESTQKINLLSSFNQFVPSPYGKRKFGLGESQKRSNQIHESRNSAVPRKKSLFSQPVIPAILTRNLSVIVDYDNTNDDDVLCANILEDRAQWRHNTNGLSSHVIVKQCASRRRMGEDAKNLRRIGILKR